MITHLENKNRKINETIISNSKSLSFEGSKKVLISKLSGIVSIGDVLNDYSSLCNKCEEYQGIRGFLLDYSAVIFDFEVAYYKEIAQIIKRGYSRVDNIAFVSNTPFNTAISILVARSVKNVGVGVFSTSKAAEQWLRSRISF